MLETARFFDLDFVADSSTAEVARAMTHYVDAGPHRDKIPTVITPNVDYIVKFTEPRYREMGKRLENSAFILPDGQPIVWASRLLRKPLRSRLTGADLFPELWKLCVEQNRKVFMVVAFEEVGKKLAEQLPNFQYIVPPFYNGENPEECEQVHAKCRRIVAEMEPDFVILGISAPKQQAIALDLVDFLAAEGQHISTLILMIGASMEFYLGLRARAPQFLQRTGFEWAHRLFIEPKRMFKRIFIDDMRFFPMVLREMRQRSVD